MLEAGSKQNIVQQKRLDKVFDLIGIRPDPRKDPAMQGICDLNEAEIAKHRTQPPAISSILSTVKLRRISTLPGMGRYVVLHTRSDTPKLSSF